jgi:adenylate cyclase
LTVPVKNIARPIRVHRILLGERPDPSEPTTAVLPKPPLALPDKASIAVLPFQNMSGDPEQEYFADGMVEEIITALSRINGSSSSLAIRASLTKAKPST